MKTYLSFAFIILLSGCSSTLSNQEAFKLVEENIGQRLGAKVLWADSRETEQEMGKRVKELLLQKLTPKSAVQIALLNNRGLQATFEELGVARADVLSAALLPNPLLSFSGRFPAGGGRANIEFGVTENFLSFLFLPLNKSIAESALFVAKNRVSDEVLALVSEVNEAFFDLQGALQDKELLNTALAASEASYIAAKQINAAGNSTNLELQNEQVLFEQTKLELAQSETEIRQHREKLTSLLGLWGENTNWEIGNRLPELPTVEPDLSSVERAALTSRLDLAAARAQIDLVGKMLGIAAPLAVFSGSEIGLDSERDVDGSWVTGPNIAFPVPLFGQGSAAIARAQSEYRASLFRYYDLAVKVQSEARAARDKLNGQKQQVEFLKKVLIPLRHSIVQETQTHYNGMLLGLFTLLAAKQAEIEAGRKYVSELREYWKAHSMLERATGKTFPVEESPSAVNTSDKTSHTKHQH